MKWPVLQWDTPWKDFDDPHPTDTTGIHNVYTYYDIYSLAAFTVHLYLYGVLK